MPENDFEKKLRLKMDALQVQPGDEVWQKVKAQVVRKNRRKRLAFFFLFAGLLTTGLLISTKTNLFNTNGGQLSHNNKTNERIAAVKPAVAKNAAEDVDEKESSIATKPVTSPVNGTNRAVQQGTVVTVTHKVYHNKTGKSKYAAADNNEEQTHLFRAAGRRTRGFTKFTPTTAVQDDNAADLSKAPAAQDQNLNNVPDLNEPVKSTAAVTPAPTAERVEKTEVQKNILQEKDQPGKTVASQNNKKQAKWNFALSFSGGISSVGFDNTEKSLAYSSDGLSNIPGNGGSPSGDPVTYYPSAAKPGFAFTAGLLVFRDISAKMKLITGVQYQSYSTLQKTGGDANQQYAGPVRAFSYGDTKTNRNQYQYLSVPAGISANLFTAGKKEIWLDAGFNYARLLKAQALAFDTAVGFYSTTTTGFNKNQLGLFVSLVVNLAGKDKPALYIGPQFQYSFTRQANTGLYTNTHSRYIGIMLRRNLRK